MSKRTKKVHGCKNVLSNKLIGFDFDVSSNYFNKNNCESDESDRVRQLLFIIMN